VRASHLLQSSEYDYGQRLAALCRLAEVAPLRGTFRLFGCKRAIVEATKPVLGVGDRQGELAAALVAGLEDDCSSTVATLDASHAGRD
jgi:hypothetical protein